MRYLISLFLMASLPSSAAVGVRLLLGIGDAVDTRWDGSVTARGARVASVEPWRFDADDAITSAGWRAAVHAIRLFGGRQAPGPVANGVIVRLEGESESSELAVKTTQGEFTVRLADIPYGVMGHAMSSRVAYDRLPPVTRITSTPDEQDYPAAAADAGGNVWIAYVEFRHSPDHVRLRLPMREELKDFKPLLSPTGGDHIVAQRFAGGAWGSPIQISTPGGDVYRPAVAVDGSGRVWVFWSANEKGNFDLWARPIENGKPGAAVRLTSDPGSDVTPAAATDLGGRVWVAWQAWRGGRAAILGATQQGNAFSKPAAVSNSTGNEWNPAMAAGPGGRVTVAWDSYRSGDYDIYMRTAAAPGKWGAETPVATSSRYEAYPSIAYDKSGRVWVAWEEGGEGWGKNFGAYDSTGVAVYQGRAIRLRAFDSEGRAFDTAADIGTVLPGVADRQVDSTTRQIDTEGWQAPHPGNAKNRAPSAATQNVVAPRNSLPRLLVDSSGRVWVVVRSFHPITWHPIGSVWAEFAVSYDGSKWTGPIFLDRSDNLLDNRPALVSTRPGELTIVNSCDYRRHLEKLSGALLRAQAAQKQKQLKQLKQQNPQLVDPLRTDPFQNDLFATVVSLPPAAGAPTLRAGSSAAKSEASAAALREREAIATLRAHSVAVGGTKLRLLRGEFHRHSEVSMDGGNDGTIIDQFRYMLDGASMDWVGCCDHDNGYGREYTWWMTQKLTDIYYTPGKFIPMFSYERSVAYPEGHRNIVFAKRGIRTLPRLPKVNEDASGKAPDTLMLYKYLRFFNGVVASHTSGTNMGTDWRDNDPLTEPVVEIYQGDRQNYEMPGAPRSNNAEDSIGGWRPKGFVNLALEMGYMMGFQASSDHISTHMSYCNILVTDGTREALLDGLKKRHVYGATDNILADVRSGNHMMGDAFSTDSLPEIHARLVGTAPFAKVHVIKDNRYVYSPEPKSKTVEFTWKDNSPSKGKASYYYVRGDQENGEIVWASPMWITYTGK
jgi:hypothetical protein